MKIKIVRNHTRLVEVGGIRIGGGAKISVQSMTKVPLPDIEGTVREIQMLSDAGADIVRVAVPDEEAARALFKVREQIKTPLVADIHFDHKLALLSLAAGVDKLRINPGNLGGRSKLAEVARAASDKGVPIRVGVNAGSLEKELLTKHGGPTPEAIAESALRNAEMLSELGFRDIVISAKSSSVLTTIAAYRLIAGRCDYPLHVGVTETGPGESGTIKSAIGIGALLADGIGDTIRVSLTGPASHEVSVAHCILASLGIGRPRINIVSCPTCGRTRGPLAELVQEVSDSVAGLQRDITVAIMGCEVNGPGEAKEADVGLALTRTGAAVFKEGQVVSTGSVESMRALLVSLIEQSPAFDEHRKDGTDV